MANARLGLLIILQLCVVRLSSSTAQSLRGSSSSVDAQEDDMNAEQVILSADSAATIDDDGDELLPLDNDKWLDIDVEEILKEEPQMRWPTDNDGLTPAFSLDMNNNNTTAVDQYHRDERGDLIFQTRIIGGRNSPDDTNSFTVSLHDKNGKHFCGGTLISKDCVLTAAHCSNAVTKKGPIKVVIGRNDLTNDNVGEVLSVRKEKLHPKYDINKANVDWQFDFALLFLTRPTMTQAKVIELNSNPNLPRGGSLVSVLGWGDTHASDTVRIPATQLQVANLRIMSNRKCDSITGRYGEYSVSYRGFIHNSMVCAKNRNRDTCQGDSGGPLAWRGKQVGVTSWGVGCNNRNFPGVYARVSSAYKWIRRNVCSLSMVPSAKFKCEPW